MGGEFKVEQCLRCGSPAAVALYPGKSCAVLVCLLCFGKMWEILDRSPVCYTVVPLEFTVFTAVHRSLAMAVEEVFTESRLSWFNKAIEP